MRADLQMFEGQPNDTETREKIRATIEARLLEAAASVRTHFPTCHIFSCARCQRMTITSSDDPQRCTKCDEDMEQYQS